MVDAIIPVQKRSIIREDTKRILVTGANGFVGSALCRRLVSEKHQVTVAVRRKAVPFLPEFVNHVITNNIGQNTDWTKAVAGVDTVVHLAARVHVMSENLSNPLDAYRQVNVAGTKKLAEDAASAGVRRFVFLSSVKVNGEESAIAYRESDDPSPEDDYGISKMEAEEQLKTIAKKSSMEIVVIRPPLVYGPGVKANFLALMKLVDRRVPLPLGSVSNQRSFIYLGNLVDCIFHCMDHPDAAGQIYLVSDDRDISTPGLIRMIADSLNNRVLLFSVPQALLRSIGILLGKGEAAKRLIGSLTVDISKIKRELEWTPPFSMESGLLKTAEWFKQR